MIEFLAGSAATGVVTLTGIFLNYRLAIAREEKAERRARARAEADKHTADLLAGKEDPATVKRDMDRREHDLHGGGFGAATPVQQVVTATESGWFWFTYSAPQTDTANFGTLFSPAVTRVQKLFFPEGPVLIWAPAHNRPPEAITITALKSGDIIGVQAPVGANVF